jgi:hypothetical protein
VSTSAGGLFSSLLAFSALLNRCNEAVASTRHGLDEARRVRRIAHGLPQTVDDRVQPVIEIDERAVRPEPLTKLIAGDQLPRPFQQLHQHFQ